MLFKTCTKCNIEKSVAEYHKNKQQKYGVTAACKVCRCLDRKQYCAANKDVVSEQKKAHYNATKDVVAEKKKAHYDANKWVVLEQRKAYYNTNKETILEKQKVYRQANSHLVNALNAKRRAFKLLATPAWADLEAIKGMYYLATIFNRIGMNLHVDHIIPLQSDLVCGLHCESNMQLMPAIDNLSKGNRHWPDQWA